MPGGWAHKPLWTPYELYGRIDHTYGWKAYNANSGWTLAQGSLNALETLAYGAYLYLVYKYGEQEEVQGTGAPDKEDMVGKLKGLSESRTVYGRVAGGAVLLAYTAAQVTFWKTVLYWLIEVFSGESSHLPPFHFVVEKCADGNLCRLRQHWPQRCVNALLHVDRAQRRLARPAGVHDVRVRPGDSARAGPRHDVDKEAMRWRVRGFACGFEIERQIGYHVFMNTLDVPIVVSHSPPCVRLRKMCERIGGVLNRDGRSVLSFGRKA